MGFGHLYIPADQAVVVAAIQRHLESKGYYKTDMTPERHPKRMKEIREDRMRLFWVSPRVRGWTAIFEYRFYANDARERWGYADEYLAVELSKEAGLAWRLEVLDGAGFWMYARYEAGVEKEGKAYQDTAADRTLDRTHPRYELNAIIDREGFANIGLGYEHIPGLSVSPIENVSQSAEGIEGFKDFVHMAFERPPEAEAAEESTQAGEAT